MKKRQQWFLSRALVAATKESDINYNGWYNTGFVFFRFLNDYIEFKTIDKRR